MICKHYRNMVDKIQGIGEEAPTQVRGGLCMLKRQSLGKKLKLATPFLKKDYKEVLSMTNAR